MLHDDDDLPIINDRKWLAYVYRNVFKSMSVCVSVWMQIAHLLSDIGACCK